MTESESMTRAECSRMTSSTGARASIGDDARVSSQTRPAGLAGASRASNRAARFGSRALADVTTRGCAIDYVTDASKSSPRPPRIVACVMLQCVSRGIPRAPVKRQHCK